MRPLKSNDWSERTLEEWEHDLLDSEIQRGACEATAWAHGRVLMFERESAAEWIIEASGDWTKYYGEGNIEEPPLPEKRPVSPAERVQVFVQGVKWWRSRGITPLAPKRERWVQRALAFPNRKRAREFLREHKHLVPEWSRRGPR